MFRAVEDLGFYSWAAPVVQSVVEVRVRVWARATGPFIYIDLLGLLRNLTRRKKWTTKGERNELHLVAL